MEWWTGNGGEMAELKRKLKVACKPRGRRSAGAKSKGPKGVRILRKAAGQAVEQYNKTITKSLFGMTLSGDLKFAHLLMSLAELQPELEEAGKVRRLRSEALELAAEPEWQGETTEDEAETRAGSREPEG